MYTRTIAAAVAASLFSISNAHFLINIPAPIPGSAIKDPLDPNGDNFPCHNAITGGPKTSMAAGSSQPLQFDLGQGANTAVHGGGSCQISISYETDATALKDPSNWKVIHSYLGGCPTNAPGNLDTAKPCAAGADGTDCVDQSLTFQVPKEVQNGDAILAWTWFNNIGNREMYMNCAQVSLTGGSNSMGSLPTMFTANIGNGCATTEQTNLQFPNPGSYVTPDSSLNYPLKAPVGTCGTSAPAGGSTTPSTGTGSGSSGAAASAAAPSAAAAAQPSTNPGGAFAEGASPTTLATQVSAAPAAATAAGSSSQPPASAPAPAAAGAGTYGPCTNGAQACTASGFYCIDSTHFGMCAWGCAVPMAVAAGTTCTGNAITMAKPKRHLHVRHAHKRNILGGSF